MTAEFVSILNDQITACFDLVIFATLLTFSWKASFPVERFWLIADGTIMHKLYIMRTSSLELQI